MKIAESTISMDSQRREFSYTSTQSRTIETRDGAGTIAKIKENADKSGRGVVEGMREFEQNQKADEEKQRKQNQARSLLEYMDRVRQSNATQSQFRYNFDEDTQISLLRKLLAALNGRKKLDPLELEQMKKNNMLDLRSPNLKKADLMAKITGSTIQAQGEAASLAVPAISIGTTGTGTVWHKITAISGIHAESEMTSFESEGLVTTQDGRSISFGIKVDMARSFTEKIDVFTDTEYIKTDPLMINLDTNVGSVSDVKFTFDLDADGRTEEISFAGKGSGFLALDKDENGRIDDGSELFGTASGDGFADLAMYDDDGNSWIDENDEIYSKLKVWTKDENGNDRLLDLKSADVGAIYLGNVSTQFSLKDEANNTNGIIQKTGIYLKESGEAGTLNHVDLTL